MKYTFKEIAFNSTEKRIPVEEDRFTYIGLEHLDSRKLSITRYGSDVPLKGEKLVITLMQKLYSLGRNEDAKKAAYDEKYRNKLYEEFELLEKNE